MRNYTNSYTTIRYPGRLEMAFDDVPIIITEKGNNEMLYKAEIYNADSSVKYTDERTTFNKKVCFDISAYVRAIMANDVQYPFRTSGNRYPTSATIVLKIYRGASLLVNTTFTAVWGHVEIGHDWNASRTVYLWSGYPNEVGIYMNDAYYNSTQYTEEGIYKITPSTEDHANITSSTQYQSFTREDRTDMDVATKTINIKYVQACSFDKGVFLRWIGRDGLPVSWLFKRGDVQHKVTATTAKRRVNDIDYVYNGSFEAVMPIDMKSEQDTMDIAYPVASSDEYEVLRGLLVSPVVEMYDNSHFGTRWVRVNIAAKTDVRKGRPLQDFTAQIILPSNIVQSL